MRRKPPRKQSHKDGVHDLEDPVTDDTEDLVYVAGTPTIFQLEETLEGLQRYDRINVMLTRKMLKWLIRTARKQLNIHFINPYYKDPKHMRE